MISGGLKRLQAAAIYIGALAAAALAQNAAADDLRRDFLFNARQNGPYQMFGRTLIGVTERDSAPWSVQLWPDFTAHFSYSSGRSAVARYSFEDGGVCFHFTASDQSVTTICKTLRPTGRGYDWLTTGQDAPSSKIVFTHEGETEALRSDPSTNIDSYRNAVIVGRTLRDREIWFAQLTRSGEVDFAYSSGSRGRGRYEIKNGAICINFGRSDTCKVPTQRGDSVLWLTQGASSAVSEIIYVIN